jgi:formylglycine-generating enzyme required for sulfatase activity
MAHDVFVSYSSSDKPVADAVCATLERKGHRCWVAPRDILPGTEWSEGIIDAISECRVFLLIFSAKSNHSQQVKREVTFAVSEGKPILPLRVEDAPLSKHMKYCIGTPHWLDAMTPPLERHLDYLADTVGLLLQRTAGVRKRPDAEQEPATATTVATDGARPTTAQASPQPKKDGSEHVDRPPATEAVPSVSPHTVHVSAPATVHVAPVGNQDNRPGSSLEVITNSIGMRLVLVPAGEFLMGSPDSDDMANGNIEKPQHRVRLTQPFYLGVYPVTQEEYERVVGTNPSHFQGDLRRPVEQVSWDDAVAFCQELSALEGVEYRLPTEAEWEYTCRAGSTTRWCFGDSEAGLGDHAWYFGNSGGATHTVGEKKPNAWGLHDMHGNIWEWCADFVSKYGEAPSTDPQGPRTGSNRVYRGGGWDCGGGYCRSADRFGDAPSCRSINLGFRVARSPSAK